MFSKNYWVNASLELVTFRTKQGRQQSSYRLDQLIQVFRCCTKAIKRIRVTHKTDFVDFSVMSSNDRLLNVYF